MIHVFRLAMPQAEYEEFWKTVQCTVDKDVVRTDRSHPYFKGTNNPHVDMMRYVKGVTKGWETLLYSDFRVFYATFSVQVLIFVCDCHDRIYSLEKKLCIGSLHRGR